eukprot:g2947.t1
MSTLVKKGRVFKGGLGFGVTCVKTTKKYIVAGMDIGFVGMWDREGAEGDSFVRKFVGHRGSLVCLDVTPNEKYLVTGSVDMSLILWEISTGKKVQSFSLRGPFGVMMNFANVVAVTPGGDGFVSGNFDGTATLWDLR